MTWNAHSFVGLFQSLFYIPTFLIAAYLLFRKHGRPRLAWLSLTIFCAVRIAGGIILIVYEHNPSVAMTIVALIFQGTGVVPLWLSTIGLLRIVKAIDFPTDKGLKTSIILMRITFLHAVVFLVTGSVLVGQYKTPSDVSIGTAFVKAGYIILVAILVWILALNLYFWKFHYQLSASSGKVLIVMRISIPFLAVRVAYACLSVFDDKKGTWSPLTGNVAAFVVMHSVMEYAVVLMYAVLGCVLPAINKTSETGEVESGRVERHARRK